MSTATVQPTRMLSNQPCRCAAFYGDGHPRSSDCYPLCGSCLRTLESRLAWFAVISPNGVAHIGEDFGLTSCGKDATREGWLWPI